MAQTTPPGIDPVPTPAPQRGDRTTFSNRVDAFILWLVAAVAQFQAVASNVYANALDAYASALASAGYRDTAQTYRDAAQAARDTAQTYRDTALTYRNGAQAAQTAAETARDAAQNYAAALTGTSTSSNVIGVGSKTFTTQAGKQFAPGTMLRFANPSNPAQWMVGPSTAYSGTTLTANITTVSAAAAGNTVANWAISISGVDGAAGPTGGVTGGNLTGALNEKRHDIVPVSASPDVWNVSGNLVAMSGSGDITGFPAAPQAGAKRTLLMSALGMNVRIVEGANLVVFGGTQSIKTEDEIDIIAIGPTYFRANVRRRDGTPVVPPKGFTPAAVAVTTLVLADSDYHTKTINGNTTFAFDFAGIPNGKTWTLELNVTSGIPSFPSSVRWPLDQAPNFAAGQIHMIVFVTAYGGTRVRASAITGYSS